MQLVSPKPPRCCDFLKSKHSKSTFRDQILDYKNIFSDKYPYSEMESELDIKPLQKNRRVFNSLNSVNFSHKMNQPISYLIKQYKNINIRTNKTSISNCQDIKLKKQTSQGTMNVSSNSDYSTVQNKNYKGRFSSISTNKLKIKREIFLTETPENNITISSFKNNFDLEKTNKKTNSFFENDDLSNDSELFYVDQPSRREFKTQRIIEELSYDAKYPKARDSISSRDSVPFIQERNFMQSPEAIKSKKKQHWKPKLRRSKSSNELVLIETLSDSENSKLNLNDNIISFKNLSRINGFSLDKSSPKKPIVNKKTKTSMLLSKRSIGSSENIFKTDYHILSQNYEIFDLSKNLKKKKN